MELSTEAQEALTTIKLDNLKKEINAKSWNNNMEGLMKIWGEKAAGLRFMHNKAANSWKKVSNQLTLWSIGITTIVSGTSLISANVENDETKNILLYIVRDGIFSGCPRPTPEDEPSC